MMIAVLSCFGLPQVILTTSNPMYVLVEVFDVTITGVTFFVSGDQLYQLFFFSLFHFQSLLLLNYLITNGSERVVTNAREHIYDMKPLEDYVFRDENGKDQGINGKCGVAHTVSLMIALLTLYVYGCGFMQCVRKQRTFFHFLLMMKGCVRQGRLPERLGTSMLVTPQMTCRIDIVS